MIRNFVIALLVCVGASSAIPEHDHNNLRRLSKRSPGVAEAELQVMLETLLDESQGSKSNALKEIQKDSRIKEIFDATQGASNQRNLVISSLVEAKDAGQIRLPVRKLAGQKSNLKVRFNKKCDPAAKYRTIDGTCNNNVWPLRGSTDQPFKRILDPVYDDGKSTPRMTGSRGRPLPGARAVSLTVHPGQDSLSDDNTVMVMQWGQFLDHDLTGTPVIGGEGGAHCCEDHVPGGVHPDVNKDGPCFPIDIPSWDRKFSKKCMEFKRSAAAPAQTPREQINLLTAYIDASNVYGLNELKIQELREGPFMKTKGNDLLPESTQEMCHREQGEWCFNAGDDRVNVFPGLTVLHTIFVREHNRIVRELIKVMPADTTDDVLFEEARKIVSAYMQQITYNEWLPMIIGQKAMEKYGLTSEFNFKYNVSADPTISNVFASAAFRFGHSAIPRFLTLGDHRVGIEKLFNRPTEVIKDLDAVLEAILVDRRQNVDRFVNTGMRDHLFETSHQNGFDVVSLNIQRGRDHGLPSYNRFRESCGLPEVFFFRNNAFTFSGASLSYVYRSVDDVDVFSGAIAEEPVKDGAVGPLLACLLGQQFQDLKYGDSFWYETQDENKGFTPSQLREIKKMNLTAILCANSGLRSVQLNPFLIPSTSNPMTPCSAVPTIDFSNW